MPRDFFQVNDDKTHVKVERLGEHRNSEKSPQNAFLFKGQDNPIKVQIHSKNSKHHFRQGIIFQLSRVYTIPFICNYNLRQYPFDTQNCSMELSAAEEGLPIKLKGLY